MRVYPVQNQKGMEHAMRFETKFFDDLTARELYEILRARADVFVGEEKILYPDADGVDYDCLHIFSRDEAGTVTAYLRMFPKQEEPGTVQIGRVLTRRRGGGLGRRLMEAALRAATETFHAGGVYVESQKHAEGFYEKLGFRAVSADFIEAGIPHVKMRRELGGEKG